MKSYIDKVTLNLCKRLKVKFALIRFRYSKYFTHLEAFVK